MTVVAGYLVRGRGCVLVADGRTTDQDGWIVSDTYHKVLRGHRLIAGFAGRLTPAWEEMVAAPPASIAHLRAGMRAARHDWEMLASDGRALWATDDTRATDSVRYGAIGCGSAVALGVLDTHPSPKSLDAAEALCRTAVRAACRRHSGCGGRVRVVRLPSR